MWSYCIILSARKEEEGQRGGVERGDGEGERIERREYH